MATYPSALTYPSLSTYPSSLLVNVPHCRTYTVPAESRVYAITCSTRGGHVFTARQDPDAKLEHAFDWGRWLAGDAITSATISVPDGLTATPAVVVGGKVSTWLSGGTEESYYRVVCRITTAGGRRDDRTLNLYITQR